MQQYSVTVLASPGLVTTITNLCEEAIAEVRVIIVGEDPTVIMGIPIDDSQK